MEADRELLRGEEEGGSQEEADHGQEVHDQEEEDHGQEVHGQTEEDHDQEVHGLTEEDHGQEVHVLTEEVHGQEVGDHGQEDHGQAEGDRDQDIPWFCWVEVPHLRDQVQDRWAQERHVGDDQDCIQELQEGAHSCKEAR